MLSWLPVLALAAAALALGALGASQHWDERGSNILFFAAWCAAILLLFVFGLRLPPRIPGSRFRAMLFNTVLAVGAIVVACLANVAIFRHDVFLDVSREAANTPPPQLELVLDGLRTDVSLFYFYNHSDANARKAKDLLTVAARQNRHFQFQAVDLDKEPAKAREFGVRAYNTALLQAEGRRVVVENTVDLAQMAFAALRVLQKQVDVVCFVSGHGEVIPEGPPHFHYSHVETLKGHEVPGAGDILEGEPDGLDRLQLAMTTLGYTVRPIVPTTLSAIPGDCNVVAEIGPRRAYPPGEAARLSDYLAHGGRLLVMIDPAFPLGEELGGLLGKVGLSSEQAVVIDPLNHYGADDGEGRDSLLSAAPDHRPGRVDDLSRRAADPRRSGPRGHQDEHSRRQQQRQLLAPGTAGVGRRAFGRAACRATWRAVLAVAVEGRWPDAPVDETKPFRLVLVGDANFATNSYFPYVSNGELAVRMIRWLVDDEARPAAKPQTFSPLQRITLTRDQMRDIFVMVELVLPMSVVLFGGIVWWRRR